jgi:hypothetical protein
LDLKHLLFGSNDTRHGQVEYNTSAALQSTDTMS